MALESVPWFVGGGAEHSPDVARMVAYAATSGGAGVLGSADFRVTELPVPGTKIRMAAGGAVIPNGYLSAPDYGKQSYITRAADVTDLDVTATGSAGGRTDLVVCRIDDPQFGGQVPADPVVGPYTRFEIIENVTPGITEVPDTLGYPAIALARLDIPVSTGTIEQTYITDLRKMAMPRKKRDLVTVRPTLTEALSSSTFVNWPSQASATVEIPTWATRVIVKGDLGGLYLGSGISSANGNLRLQLGTLLTQNTYYDADISWTGEGYVRIGATVGDTLTIPVEMRGTTQTLRFQANKVAGTKNLTSQASFTFAALDFEFEEVPD